MRRGKDSEGGWGCEPDGRREEEEGEVTQEMKSAAVLLYLRKHLDGGQ